MPVVPVVSEGNNTPYIYVPVLLAGMAVWLALPPVLCAAVILTASV